MAIGRFEAPVFSPNNDIGATLPGGKLEFFETGASTTQKNTFTDSGLGTPNSNPVVADGDGRFADIYLDTSSGTYRAVLSDSDDVQIWERDNVTITGADPLLLANGTAGAPRYSYSNDTDTGDYLIAVGRRGTAVGGNLIVEIDANGLDIVTSGEVANPSLILEADTDTGWYQGAANNWVFSSTGQKVLTLALSVVTLHGATGANNILIVEAKTGRESQYRATGVDIIHGMTDLAPTNTYFKVSPFSATGGGTEILGLSDSDLEALVLKGIIGSTNPTDTVAAVQVIAGKKSGTGLQDLAAAETAFEVVKSDGTTSLLRILGNGDLVVTAGVLAASNDAGAIGASGTAFSDLFLASGAVINFNSGNVTLTQASNALTLGGGDAFIANGFGMVIGNSSQLTVNNQVPELQVLGTTSADSTIMIHRASTNVSAPGIYLSKERGAIGSQTTIVSGDILGTIHWFGSDGTDLDTQTARVQVTSTGTIGTGRIPTKMELFTGTDAASTVLTLGLAIDSAQNVTIPNGTLTVNEELTIVQTTTSPALDINHSGATGTVVEIDTETSGFAMVITTVAAIGGSGIDIIQNSSTGVGLRITNDGHTLGTMLILSTDQATSESSTMASFTQDHASATNKSILELQNDGAGDAGAGVYFDFNNDPAANTTGAVTSFTTGATVQGSVKIEVGGATRFIEFTDAPTS